MAGLVSKFFCFVLLLVLEFNAIAQSDEMNFSVANEEQVDTNLEDSIFYSLSDALKNPLKVRQLVLQGKGLKRLPSEVYTFKNLRALDISHNRIAYLSDSVFRYCTQMEEIRYAGNQLRSIPKAVYQPKLKVLDLSENNITSLPDSIAHCISLEELDLHANDLSKLPSEKVLLKKLKSLILSENNIGKNNKWIFLQPKLKILFLDETELETLDNALCKASSLKFLNVEGNNLKTLPSCICNLKGLKVIQVGNQFPKEELEKTVRCLPELKVR